MDEAAGLGANASGGAVRGGDGAGEAVAVQAEVAFDADVAVAGGAEALGERVGGVGAGMGEGGEKGLAAGAHADDFGGGEGEVEGGAVGLGDAAEEEDVVVAGDDEDDFAVRGGVGGDGEGGGEFGEVGAVVDDADEGAAEGEARLVAGELAAGEAGGVDDGVGGEALAERVFLVEEVAVDGLGDEFGAFALHEDHEPFHGAVRVDDGG